MSIIQELIAEFFTKKKWCYCVVCGKKSHKKYCCATCKEAGKAHERMKKKK